MNLAVELGTPEAYRRAQKLLSAGRHPAFIGPMMISRQASRGGLLFAVAGRGASARDAAIAVVNARNSTLLVLNVHPRFRRAGVGSWFLDYLRPNFARVVMAAVPWFQGRGYTAVGAPKLGRRLYTQIMVRQELIGLSGRAARCLAAACTCDHL